MLTAVPPDIIHGLAQVALAQAHVKNDQGAFPDGRAARAVVVGLQLASAHDVGLGKLGSTYSRSNK
jgi:hypothetical protein